MGDPPQPSSTQPTSGPTSRPAENERLQARVTQLVERLRSARFQEREAAQKDLQALGDQAAKYLVAFIHDADEEVATRVAAIIVQTNDPALRVELAVNLLETTDPDWMEPGVHMLFKGKPEEVCERFTARTRDATGVKRSIFLAVAEQLESWRRADWAFQQNYQRIKAKSPEKAASLLAAYSDTPLYHAEAAYWSAWEALEDASEYSLEEGTTKPGGS